MTLVREVAIINLARRFDRLHSCVRRVVVTDIGQLRVPVSVWAAVEHEQPDQGCLQSHLHVLDNVDHSPVLVLEDDACFNHAFSLNLKPPADWEILWLGGQHKRPPRPLDHQWVVPTYLVRTHAYIARFPRQVAELLRDAPRMDPYLAALPLRQYALRHNTVGQTAGTSDIDGTVRDADEYWHLRYHPRFDGGKPHPSNGQY